MTMRNGLVLQSTKFKKQVASTDTSDYKVVFRDQLVVGFPIDEAVLAFQTAFDSAIVSPAYDVWDVRTKPPVCNRFLELFLKSPQAIRYYVAKLRGTTARRRTLPDDLFLALDVPLPPLGEQKRIAGLLDRAEALRASRRAALALLDTLPQAIFTEMFGDPVTNPQGWPVRKVSQIGTVLTGNTPPRAEADNFGDAIEWIKSDNINGPDYYVTRAAEGLSEKGKAISRLAPRGSILITCIAGSPDCIGKAAMTDREVAFNQQINAIIVTEGDPYFFFGQLRTGKKLVQQQSTEGMKGIVSKSKLEAVRLICPPLPLQQEFARRVAAVEEMRASQRASLAKLDELFASLQHRAFRGEL